MQTQAKVIAAIIALGGFVVALLAGMYAGNPAHVVLLNALIALIACQILGIAVGTIAFTVVDGHVARHKAEHPIPDIDVESSRASSPTPDAKAFAENV